MPYGSAHTSTIPTVSSTVGPTYATYINAAIAELRATVDARVTPSGMSMSADLSFLVSGTYSGVTDLFRANFQDKVAAISAATYPNALYVVGGELYYNDADGNQVQVTSGGALNAAAATGGITGAGYGTGGVEVNWAVGDTAYKLKSGASTYAHAWLRNVYLNDGDTNFIRLIAPAIAADYSVTFPTAVPGSTQLLQMSSAGVLSASNTVANAATFSGLITASAGLTAAANQSITISGTARYKFADYIRSQHASEALLDDIANWVVGLGFIRPLSAGTLYIPVSLNLGETFSRIDIAVQAVNVESYTADLYYIGADGTVSASIASDTSTTGGGTVADILTLNPADFATVGSRFYFVKLTASGGSADLKFFGSETTYQQT